MTAKNGKPLDDFELQPAPEKSPVAAEHGLEIEPELEPLSPEEAAAELAADGPPPSSKVDFENLPEFVWQRQMLRTVRNWTLAVTGLILVVALICFLIFGKKTQELLKPATDPLPKEALDPGRN